jgi:4-hydroxybenzoate polyprenyltransferase
MAVISKSVLLHLRLPFSLMLLPVYLFALSSIYYINNSHALLVFIILHLFIYPASNGYNSYFDKDEGSIALIKTPPKVNRTLYITSIMLEWFGTLLALLVSWQFALCVLVYNLLSKAYSHPSIRLKKYPIISFLVVFIFQGGFIYLTCFYAVNNYFVGFTTNNFMAAFICSCLIGGSYPLTQVYQHEEDTKRGDQTLSILLGINGSFIFSGLVLSLGFILMFFYWQHLNMLHNFWVFLLCCLPVLGYFSWWFIKVLKNQAQANFKNTMQMTLVSSSSILVYFLWLLLAH